MAPVPNCVERGRPLSSSNSVQLGMSQFFWTYRLVHFVTSLGSQIESDQVKLKRKIQAIYTQVKKKIDEEVFLRRLMITVNRHAKKLRFYTHVTRQVTYATGERQAVVIIFDIDRHYAKRLMQIS